jgi:hypothetical protein
MIDRPTLVRMPKEDREIAIVQAIVSIADSLRAIKDEVSVIRGRLDGQSVEAATRAKGK